MSFTRFLIFLPAFICFSITAIAQTADTTQGCAPLKTTFKGPSGQSSYYWDFKDGTTSNLQNPQNVFTNPGVYNVTLQSSPGGSVIGTVQINVYAVPIPSVVAPVTCTPANVTIQSNSTINPAIQVTQYSWDFLDDGTLVTTTTPYVTHVYSTAGQYSLSLNLQTNLPGCDVTKILNNAVTLVSPPVASFSTTPAITATCNDSIHVAFANTSTGALPLNYYWNLGLGQGDTSILMNPPAQTYQKGSYTASLTVSYQSITGCSASASQVISAGKPSLKINATQDTVNILTADTIKIVAPPAGYYLWNIPTHAAALNHLNSDSLAIVFGTDGVKTIQLIYTTPDGRCTDTATTQIISVGKFSLKIKAKHDTVCLYTADTINTINAPAGDYLWHLDSNSVAIGPPVLSTLFASFNTGGWHTLQLLYSDPYGLLTDTATTQVYVDSVGVKISQSDTFTCQTPITVNYNAITNQPNLTYSWQITRTAGTYTSSQRSGNYLTPFKTIDSVKNVSSFSYTYYSESDSVYYGVNQEEDFTTNVTVVSPKTGCKATASNTVRMWLPNARYALTTDGSGCAPLGVLFDNLSAIDNFPWKNTITSSEWIFGDGQTQTLSNTDPVSHTYTTPGTYYPKLVITTSEGCKDTSFAIPVQVGGPISTVDFTSNQTTVCIGQPIQLSVVNPSPLVSAYQFITDNNNVSQCNTGQSVTFSYRDTTGPQTVMLTMDYNGCLSTVTKTNYITVNGSVPRIGYYALCSSPLIYNFTSNSSNAASVSWNFGDGQTSTSATQAHTYTNSGDYSVTLTTTSSGCPNDSATALIHVRNLKAKITLTDSLLCINQLFTFSAAQSIDVNANCSYGYTWQFPDVSSMRPYTSPDTSYETSFGTSGKHVIRLVVRDINECTDTTTKTVKVFTITNPSPYISKSSICIPAIDSLQSLFVGDTTLVKWQWSFGDGKDTTFYDLQGSKKFTHSYTTPATSSYFISVLVTDTLGCTASATTSINYYQPTSTISTVPTNTNICIGDSITLSATDFTSQGSSLAFAWTLGNGQTSTSETVGPIGYAVGNYTAKLIYKEKSSGCIDSLFQPITVQSYPVTRIATTSDTICAPANIVFYDSTTSTFPTTNFWNYGNGHLGSGSGSAWAYDKGTYNIVLIDQTSNGCADTARKTLHLYRPEGSFSINKNTICRYDSITFSLNTLDTADVTKYIWSLGDGTTITNQNPVVHEYNYHPQNGSTVAKLVLYDGICPNNPPLDTTINIQEVIAGFNRLNGTDTAICLLPTMPYTFTNTSQNADTYTWFFGDGSSSTTLSPSHQYVTAGTYKVTLAIANSSYGCTDTLTQTAVVNPNPNLVATGDTACLGKSPNLVVVNPDTSSHYLWSPSTGLSNPNSPTPTVNLQQSVVYTLLQTNKYGCTDTAQVPAIIIQKPPFRNWDTTIVIGDSIPLPIYGRPIYNFQWTPTDSLYTLSCLNCNYPIANPKQDITYVVTVTDIRNCFTTSYDYVITVEPNTFIKMPTSFTPNGDGKNDILYVKGWGIKELMSYEIFNRWGQRIYSSSDLNQGWDGRFQGTLQNEDVYVYKVIATDWHDKDISAEGYINLLH